jgi:hypothetical protein
VTGGGGARSWLWRSPVVPGVLIAAMVAIALLSTGPTSGLDVYVRLGGRPYAGLVTLTRRGAHEVVTGHRAGVDGHFRLRLAAGFYVLHPVREARPGAPTGRDVQAQVRQNRFAAVTVRFRVAGTPRSPRRATPAGRGGRRQAPAGP